MAHSVYTLEHLFDKFSFPHSIALVSKQLFSFKVGKMNWKKNIYTTSISFNKAHYRFSLNLSKWKGKKENQNENPHPNPLLSLARA